MSEVVYNWIGKGANIPTIVQEDKPKCADDTFAHHWVIDPSGTTTSNGTCKKCGNDRLFLNSAPVSTEGGALW